MELLDEASAREDIFREESLKAQLKAIEDAKRAAHDTTHCFDCAAEIPEARRKASPGTTLCIGCATLREHDSKVRYGTGPYRRMM